MDAPAPAELAVVVVAYNCRDLLDDCLASLEAQRESIALDVVVVDNASEDGAAELVRERYPWVRLLESDENVGFACANNRALRLVSAPHVLLLNPDTVVPQGALRRAVDELARRPDVGMLGVKLVRPDGSLDHACKRGFPTPLAALAYFVGVGTRYTAAHVGEDEVAEVDAVNGAFMLVRATALADVGDLDEQFWMYGEDLDWCRRFWDARWRILYWPRVAVVHVKGGSSGASRSKRANAAFHEAMWLFYRKHATGRARLAAPLVWAAIRMKLAWSLAAARG